MSLSTLDNNHWLWSSGDIDPGSQTDIVLGAKFLFVWPLNFVDQTEGCPRVHILSAVPDPDVIWSVHVISRYYIKYLHRINILGFSISVNKSKSKYNISRKYPEIIIL